MADFHALSDFIWSIADLLRGPYRPNQYERVILPLLVLRRFDCVLDATKQQVLDKYKELSAKKQINDGALNRAASKPGETLHFHNHSPFDFQRLKADPQNIVNHLTAYLEGFSENVRIIFDRFDFKNEIAILDEHNILYLIVAKFADVDLHPDTVPNHQMGELFEDLIRRFNEANNQEAGDYFTPRDVIELMVDVLFSPDDKTIAGNGKIIEILDPTCGTGGMLSESERHIYELNDHTNVWVYGQDYNPRAYAVAASDMLMKGSDKSQIEFGDTLTDDKFGDKTFDYFLANPPFGVDWKKQQQQVTREHQTGKTRDGRPGRFSAGLPRINDGALLFLQHMVSKFTPYEPNTKEKTGSRLAIVFNGSPLFTGGAGSGESEIRKWIIEQDLLEAIIALPEQMFFNTGIGTYIWILSNRRRGSPRQGKIQLIDARDKWMPMRRSLGDKRRQLGRKNDPVYHIKLIVDEYANFVETPTTKIFDRSTFGYNRVPIERPLRLLFTMDVERKSRFLDAFPHLLDDVQAIDRKWGGSAHSNWTKLDADILSLLKQRGNKWKAQETKEFRKVFTDAVEDYQIRPVVKDRKKKAPQLRRVWGWFDTNESDVVEMYEPNSDLRDFENVELVEIEREAGASEGRIQEDFLSPVNEEKIIDYVEHEVIEYVRDAWADRPAIRSAFEINFNRYFYAYTPPRPLAEIDGEIKMLEQEIVRLLREVTE